jgi:hypothetical protein
MRALVVFIWITQILACIGGPRDGEVTGDTADASAIPSSPDGGVVGTSDAGEGTTDSGLPDAGSIGVCADAPLTCQGIAASDLCAVCYRGHCMWVDEMHSSLGCMSDLDPSPLCGEEADELLPGTSTFDAPFVAVGGLHLPDVDGPGEIFACADGFLWELVMAFLPSDQPSKALLAIEGQIFTAEFSDLGPRWTPEQSAVALHNGRADVCLPYGPEHANAVPAMRFGLQVVDEAGRRSVRSCGRMDTYIPVPGPGP